MTRSSVIAFGVGFILGFLGAMNANAGDTPRHPVNGCVADKHAEAWEHPIIYQIRQIGRAKYLVRSLDPGVLNPKFPVFVYTSVWISDFDRDRVPVMCPPVFQEDL